MRTHLSNAFVAVILAGGLLTSCTQSSSGPATQPCTNNPVTADSSALLAYARSNGITPTADPTGLYYQIVSPGTGPVLTANSVVFVTYTGTLLNGTIFDSTTNYARTGFPLGGLIGAWQIGLTKISAGGRIKLLVPSAMGYGCAGSPPAIPSNAPLFFDVTVVSAK
jgi:FKBP-type peptidyl-prolyl cis-trans isomerase